MREIRNDDRESQTYAPRWPPMVGTLDEEPTTTISPNTDPRHAGVSSTRETTARRRKVRKGTRSCWECKRRKIRCIFSSSEDVACIGCQRRRTPCVSQEMPEDLSPARIGNRHLGHRIAKVEGFMKELLAGKDVGATGWVEGEPQQDQSPGYAVPKGRSKDSASSSIRASLTHTESPGEPTPNSSLAPDSQRTPSKPENETALHHLLASFPTEADVGILLIESSKTSLYMDLINTQPHSKLTYEALATPVSPQDLPGSDTHPILLARRLLIFAITLQSPCGEQFLGLSEPQSVLRRRFVTAATTWVTAREEMHGTVDSLICIILEGVFETNSGNLRRAWAVYRRAMTAAQLMGLHRSPMPPLKRIDPELDAKPEFLWFRIVYMDRYLSILLGLPQGTSDKSMGTMSGLQHEPPLGRFERQLTVLASRILERNESAFATSGVEETKSIDSELLSVSKSMPAIFWRPANFHNLTAGSPDTLLETLHLAAQVYYYGLLIQLHLPYMMRIGDNVQHEYSKITCVNASREIITRFIAHRSFNPTSSCSRPVDFFALLAALTLLLAHMDGHHHQQAINFLAHQRLSDRAMLDQALEIMDVINNITEDPTTEESAKLIRRLLDIETDATEGSRYTTRRIGGDDAQESTRGCEELLLNIPYLGVIKIARQGPISREPRLGDALSGPQGALQVELPHREPLATYKSAFQSLHSAPPTNQPFLGHSQASECLNAQPQESGQGQTMMPEPNPSHDNLALEAHMGLPTVATSANDWVFQGVDMAFFDSLLRGTSCVDDAGLEQQWIEDP